MEKAEEFKTIDLEKGADGTWRMRSEQAEAEADAIESGVSGLTEMAARERAEALKEQLKLLREENSNRFLAEALARRIAAYEATAQYEEAMAGLGMDIDVRA